MDFTTTWVNIFTALESSIKPFLIESASPQFRKQKVKRMKRDKVAEWIGFLIRHCIHVSLDMVTKLTLNIFSLDNNGNYLPCPQFTNTHFEWYKWRCERDKVKMKIKPWLFRVLKFSGDKYEFIFSSSLDLISIK